MKNFNRTNILKLHTIIIQKLTKIKLFLVKSKEVFISIDNFVPLLQFLKRKYFLLGCSRTKVIVSVFS